MKSDNTWDLGTEGGQQLLVLLIPTTGVRVTAEYAEKARAHKVTLNHDASESSDIFARCSSKL